MSAQDQESDGTVTGINVTPMVDIMLVLLIVFMVTAHFVTDGGLKVNLPKAVTMEPAATPALRVTVDAEGNLFLQEMAVDQNGLAAQLAREVKLNPNVRVTVAADQRLVYQRVVETLDVIKQSGVKRVALAAEK